MRPGGPSCLLLSFVWSAMAPSETAADAQVQQEATERLRVMLAEMGEQFGELRELMSLLVTQAAQQGRANDPALAELLSLSQRVVPQAEVWQMLLQATAQNSHEQGEVEIVEPQEMESEQVEVEIDEQVEMGEIEDSELADFVEID